MIYECGFTNNRLLKTFLNLNSETRHLRFDTLLSLALRFSFVFPPLTVLPLFFLSSLHCLRAIGKHCLPLFFFTIDFCMCCISLMFCLMPLLRSCLGRFLFAFYCAFLVVVVILLRHIFAFHWGIFYLHFLDFHWDEIQRGMIWMHQEIKRNAKIMTMFFGKELWLETQSTTKKKRNPKRLS